jgi:carbonic anhydrase
VVTDNVIRLLPISQRKLGTRDVMLIHHADFGMQKLTDDSLAANVEGPTTDRWRGLLRIAFRSRP